MYYQLVSDTSLLLGKGSAYSICMWEDVFLIPAFKVSLSTAFWWLLGLSSAASPSGPCQMIQESPVGHHLMQAADQLFT